MRTFKIKVTFFDETTKRLQATEEKLKRAGNVNEYVFKKLGVSLTYGVRKIEVFYSLYSHGQMKC